MSNNPLAVGDCRDATGERCEEATGNAAGQGDGSENTENSLVFRVKKAAKGAPTGRPCWKV